MFQSSKTLVLQFLAEVPVFLFPYALLILMWISVKIAHNGACYRTNTVVPDDEIRGLSSRRLLGIVTVYKVGSIRPRFCPQKHVEAYSSGIQVKSFVSVM